MQATTKVRKVGTSLGVLIPAVVARSLRMNVGTPLTMIVTDTEIILKLKHPDKNKMLNYLESQIAEGLTEDLEV